MFLGDWAERRRDAAARPPIVVLLGGPSAEHDVSVVSGTAIAEALASNRPRRRADPDRPRRPLVVAAGRPPPRAAANRPPTTTRPRSGATGPLTAGAALDRLARAEPRPVVFIALHGPFGEDGTVQAMLEAAGLAYTGSGVTASALGMDKAVFKRLDAGDRAAGRRLDRGPRVALAGRARRPSWAELEAFAAGTGDPRLMVKPSRLGSSVGITLAHGPDEYAAALDEAFRYDTVALAEAYLAGARDLEVSVIGNDHARLELYGPGEILAGHEFYDYAAKYTPGLSETSITRRGLDPDAGRDPEDRPRRLPGDRRRGLRPDRLPASAATSSSCPRSTRSRASPRSASSRRCPPTAATRSPTSARRSSTSRSSATPARAGGDARAGRPAAMTVRPARRIGGPGRRTRDGPADGLAGLTPVRAGAALALLLSAAAIYGLAATSAFGFSDLRITGATITGEAAIRDRLGLAKGTNLFEIPTDPLAEVLTEIPAVAAADVSVGLPDTVTVDIHERQPILVWRVDDRRWYVDDTGLLFAEAPTSPPGDLAGLPVIADDRLDVARARGSARRSTRSTSTPPAGSPR